MKITMLGKSGSGKTVYMSAMSELFYNGTIHGYSIANRQLDVSYEAEIFKQFNKVNTLYQFGRFPAGTSETTVMPLELQKNGQRLIDIDWIDYRGDALLEMAKGENTQGNAEILAALYASDVILVFVDATVLKLCPQDITARALIGANEISNILSIAARKKKMNVVFILSKIDASTINIQGDLEIFRNRITSLYSRFFSCAGRNLNSYSIIEVGALGYGNVQTTSRWIDDGLGGVVPTFQNRVTNMAQLSTIHIASSFASALLMCIDSEINNQSTNVQQITLAIDGLKNELGTMWQNIIDILFCSSRKRTTLTALFQRMQASRNELNLLQNNRMDIEAIARECY